MLPTHTDDKAQKAGLAAARKAFAAESERLKAEDVSTIESFDPRILLAFDHINRFSPKNSIDAIRRAADLIEWLDRQRPRFILELGSGRSSVVFSVWAFRTGARHLAFEQSDDWCQLTREAVRIAGGAGEISKIPASEISPGRIRYTRDIPDEADFIYLDGPSGRHRSSDTPKEQVVFCDVPDHLRGGGRPRTILVDGRLASCRHILALPAVADYTFFPQYLLAMELNDRASAAPMNRHTAFVRRT